MPSKSAILAGVLGAVIVMLAVKYVPPVGKFLK